MHDDTWRGRPRSMHQYRSDVLETIAVLAGFHTEIIFPDGCRPDVARVSATYGVFLGDAKHSEGPDDEASLRRLRHYALWLVCPGRRAKRVFAVCHRIGQGRAWRLALNDIAKEICLEAVSTALSRRVASDAEVTWLVSGAMASCKNVRLNKSCA